MVFISIYLYICSNTPPMDVSDLQPSLGTPNQTYFHGTPLYQVCIPNQDILQGCFRLFDWLSLPCLVPCSVMISARFFGSMLFTIWMWHVTWWPLSELLTWYPVKFLQFIWRSDTNRQNLCVLDLQMNCTDLTGRLGTRIVVPVMATRMTCPISEELLVTLVPGPTRSFPRSSW